MTQNVLLQRIVLTNTFLIGLQTMNDKDQQKIWVLNKLYINVHKKARIAVWTLSYWGNMV